MAALATGCTPSLDWREVRPAGTAVTVLLPCKPAASTRTVSLVGQTMPLSMLACKADGWTWALVSADVVDPARVGPALLALREGTRANVQGRLVSAAPSAVRGATPHEAQAAVALLGHKPDGTSVSARMVVFSHGTKVFQAVVMGPQEPGPAGETFFDSLRVAP